LPVEAATYISDLVPANPTTTDAVNQGDDHLRLVKQVLQTTLPNANAPITATPTNLNNGHIPIGGIIMWSGSVASIPANWHLCDGLGGTIDLRDRFIVGAGNSYAALSFGGSLTTTSDGSHSHTGATGGHVLSSAEVPGETNGGGPGNTVAFSGGSPAAAAVAHTHPISADGAHTHTATPPYMALAYIQRIS
jgi:hypothetical protein